MARFRGSVCSVGLFPVVSDSTPCSFHSRFSMLEVLLSTELVGLPAPWHMPNWTLFRRPAIAVHSQIRLAIISPEAHYLDV
jgi:hypothetical protein